MLHRLTQYLLQYKTLTVPHVGTVRLVQQSAQLDVADKRLRPPGYAVELSDEQSVPEHQRQFLDAFGADASNGLERFGRDVQRKMADGGFAWDGIGIIVSPSQVLPLAVPALQALPAEKVIRQDASHTVLRGDREMTTVQIAEGRAEKKARRKVPTTVVIGWVLLALALVAVALLLYAGKFNVGAAGSKLRSATGSQTATSPARS